MEQIINQVQTLRAAHGLKPLANPAKLGKAKLEAALAKLEAGKISKGSKIEPDHSEANKTIKAALETEKAIDKAKAKPEPKVKVKTIKALSCELLCEVVGQTEEGRTIGRSYQSILDKVLEQRPGAKTSLNCLRWYAGKIRVLADGYHQYTLPQLRERPVKSEEEKVETEEA